MESNNSHRVIANKLSCLLDHHLSSNRSVITMCSISLCRRIIPIPCFGHDADVNYVPGVRLWQQIYKIKVKLFYFLWHYSLLSPTQYLLISKISAQMSSFPSSKTAFNPAVTARLTLSTGRRPRKWNYILSRGRYVSLHLHIWTNFWPYLPSTQYTRGFFPPSLEVKRLRLVLSVHFNSLLEIRIFLTTSSKHHVCLWR